MSAMKTKHAGRRVRVERYVREASPEECCSKASPAPKVIQETMRDYVVRRGADAPSLTALRKLMEAR